MPKFFFPATKSAHLQITTLFDFVWPTATAMWNLRWQVEGFVKVVPDATVEQLNARFAEGTNIHGANLRRACIDHSWNDQEESFGRIILTNSIAIYEGWIEEILKSLGKNTKALQNDLQFPGPSVGGSPSVTSAIGAINIVESIPLKDSFHASLLNGRYCALPKLNAMLTCYRFFKELRNCDMHRGGIADQRLLDAYGHFVAVATPAALGLAEVPVHAVPVIDTPVRISLRGVVGFTGMLFKIIATLDAELSRSKLAEKSFFGKWKAIYPHKRTLSGIQKKRETQINRMAANAGFPPPSNANKLGDWLNQLGLSQF